MIIIICAVVFVTVSGICVSVAVVFVFVFCLCVCLWVCCCVDGIGDFKETVCPLFEADTFFIECVYVVSLVV